MLFVITMNSQTLIYKDPSFRFFDLVKNYKYALVGSFLLHALMYILSNQSLMRYIPLEASEPPPQSIKIQIQTSQITPQLTPQKLVKKIKPTPKKILKPKNVAQKIEPTPLAPAAPVAPAISNRTFKESILKNHKPRYPRLALRKGWSGRVMLKLLVEPNGAVKSVEVLNAPKYDGFVKAAIQAAKKWRFRPSKNNASFFVKKDVAFSFRK